MSVDFNKGMRPNLYELMQGLELPIATDTTLGAVIIGRGVEVDENGVISVTAPAPVDSYTKEEIDDQQEAQDYNINSNALAIERLEAAVEDTYNKDEIDAGQLEQDRSIAANAAAIETLNTDMSTIQGQQQTQDTNIGVNAQAILGLQTDVATIQGQQQTQDTKIAANAAAIDDLEAAIASITTDYYTKAEIDTQQTTQDTAIGINTQNISNLQGDVTAIQGQQQTQDTNIAANAAAIAANAAAIAAGSSALIDETTARENADTALAGNIAELSNREATDTLLGLIKTNSNMAIYLNDDGQLIVGGRLGQYPSGGVYYPDTMEPTGVGGSTFLMSDGAKGLNAGSREFCILAGANITNVRSAAAGSTVYYVPNTQGNRGICFAAQNGFAAIDQNDAITNGTAHIESIVFANGDPISFYFGPTEADNDIIITLSRSVNPEAATTKLRLYGNSTSTDVITIGQGSGNKSGKALTLGQSCFTGGNQTIALGNNVIVIANNSSGFGHTHLINKQFCFASGQGHDFTNASNGSSAVGICSELDANTAFAVGNGVFSGTGDITRSNAFAVTKNGGIVLKSPNGTKFEITVDNTGNLIATQL